MEKIKHYVGSHKEEIYTSLIIVFVGFASYGAGILSVKEGKTPNKSKIEIRNSVDSRIKSAVSEASVSKTLVPTPEAPKGILGDIVASKNGVAYYLPGCGGANRILDKNKIYFKNEEEAKSAGYRIAATCKK